MKSFYSVMKKANEIDQELKRLLKENKDFRREYAKINASGGSGSDLEALMKRYGATMNTQAKGGGGFNPRGWANSFRDELEKVRKGMLTGFGTGVALGGIKNTMYETDPEDVPLLEDLGVTLGIGGAMHGGLLGARKGKPFSFGRSLAGSLAGALPGYGYAFYSANERSKGKQ